ncbi:hypothetical protein P6281_06635 [Mycobacterium sp. 5-140-3-2]|uniref:hypothetical protein n=1 Tax=unclassified Mycobacterium TaxID=2642494 RepID=UPI002D77A472|nr:MULTISPECIES: hypothetical protein [unclassified Mycobacterium]WRU83595.1 hypothetical protein P6281_06635 [Mycobacterium sp. 5-140-3-2]WSE40259.1 hypothetical protein QGN28_19480 [Mycobacterium sp. 5-140-3-1]
MATAHCQEAQTLLDALDAKLAKAAERQGVSLAWTAAEQHTLDILADTIDRRTALTSAFDAASEAKVQVKLSTEIRQLDRLVVQLLAKIEVAAPKQPESLRTLKAREAANARWGKHA